MPEVLGIVFPIFAAAALGFGLVRFAVFNTADMHVLGRYVLNIALPALLCGAVARRDMAEVLNLGYLWVFALGGLATIALVYLFVWLKGVGPARRAVAVMGASCPNSGYVGFPVMLLVFPDLAGVILALNFLVENVLLIPLCLLLMDLARPGKDRSFLRVLGGVVLGLLKRPMVLGLLAGFAISLSGLGLPAPVLRTLDMLAASSSALALVVIGGSLAGLPVAGDKVLASQIALAKLVLHPALVAGALVTLPLLGLPVPEGALATAVVLSAAMPMLGIYPILAQDHGQQALASLSLLLATVGAAFTLTLLLAWLV
ncbi:AEC family transporter [Lutimaribacter sp. EGI FJ00015]|uniref:AEC family transporter n=1 Tax=Lutimaribacter degradans TaxID=2945989 RepID=A0ACC5ZZF4_9RHOB|nr:AEC family transporter [Lutimaribacter sp. EGI FJ00013]MCM2563687.1 AEC family transporter [Lutimaribacter sp. EGI FJ00013]MCO0614871.1 AEC family transporter [Lutimaribacter sp. EGI FJ00015]MCO0637539.1 AEC family transporter [Lutimaribacter sp. EGI FJ00014]